MTTLRIEVGRCSGTTVEDVVAGLRLAGCMKYLEIDPDAHAFLPIEELKAALEGERFDVVVRPEPPPPPLPWWRRVRGWPHRVYYWGRRVFLREREIDQFMHELQKAYEPSDELHRVMMQQSPFLMRIQRPEEGEDTERFLLHGRGTAHRQDWHPICWKCGARFPNGPGQYAAKCPECGERWDGSEASDPPL